MLSKVRTAQEEMGEEFAFSDQVRGVLSSRRGGRFVICELISGSVLLLTRRPISARLCLMSLPGATGSRAAGRDGTLGGRGCGGAQQAQDVERFRRARHGLRMTHVWVVGSVFQLRRSCSLVPNQGSTGCMGGF